MPSHTQVTDIWSTTTWREETLQVVYKSGPTEVAEASPCGKFKILVGMTETGAEQAGVCLA